MTAIIVIWVIYYRIVSMFIGTCLLIGITAKWYRDKKYKFSDIVIPDVYNMYTCSKRRGG